MEEMKVPEARMGSIEYILRHESAENKLLIFNHRNKNDRLNLMIPHRAIGVVYHPEREKHGNYVPTILSSRYRRVSIHRCSEALHPLHLQPDGHKTPETYPFNY